MRLILIPAVAAALAGCLDLDALQSGRRMPAGTAADAAPAAADAAEAPDLAPAATGCATGRGRVVSPNMHACAGAWPVGQGPGSLCAAGWSWCAANPISADACQAALPTDEVYLARSPISQPTAYPWVPASTKCTWAGTQSSGLRGLGGCGNGKPNISGPPNVVACGGWPLVMHCWSGGASPSVDAVVTCPWTQANDSDLTNTLSADPAHIGALCCR